MEFWREATVDAKELLVHDRGKREIAEAIHASVIDCIGILMFACRVELAQRYPTMRSSAHSSLKVK